MLFKIFWKLKTKSKMIVIVIITRFMLLPLQLKPVFSIIICNLLPSNCKRTVLYDNQQPTCFHCHFVWHDEIPRLTIEAYSIICIFFRFLEVSRQERSADQATRQVRSDRCQRRLEHGQRVCPQVHQQRVHRKTFSCYVFSFWNCLQQNLKTILKLF